MKIEIQPYQFERDDILFVKRGNKIVAIDSDYSHIYIQDKDVPLKVLSDYYVVSKYTEFYQDYQTEHGIAHDFFSGYEVSNKLYQSYKKSCEKDNKNTGLGSWARLTRVIMYTIYDQDLYCISIHINQQGVPESSEARLVTNAMLPELEKYI